MKAFFLILSFTWKFALTFPVAVYGFGMSFFEVIVYSNIGGLIGLVFFSFISKVWINFWKIRVQAIFKKKKNYDNSLFNSKYRKIVRIKNRYGFIGIVIFNPVFISIPISAFLVKRYYRHVKFNLVWVFLGQLIWSVIYTYFYIFIKQAV